MVRDWAAAILRCPRLRAAAQDGRSQPNLDLRDSLRRI
jgi:hypothetical protein